MTPKKTDAKKVPSDRARIYWDKSQDFFRLMRDASQSSNWNGAGLAAVHCAVSATDALLVAKAARRSSSKAHEDAAELLSEHIHHPQTADQAKRLRAILREKTLIESVDKVFRQEDALSLQMQVERYVVWARALLNF